MQLCSCIFILMKFKAFSVTKNETPKMVRYVRLYLQVVPTFCRTFQQWLQSICLHPCHVFMIIHYFQHEKKNGAVATSSFMLSTNVDSVSFDITITLYIFFVFS